MRRADFGIVGGGIVGLATAYQLQERFPDSRVVVWEKESSVARHQTGRNSGVIHTGVYYKPGSLKARLSRRGQRLLKDFCDQKEIPYTTCGKLIIARSEPELDGLSLISQQADKNGIYYETLTSEEIPEREPFVRGLAGIHIPEASIVDFAQVARTLAKVIEEKKGRIHRSVRVLSAGTSGSGRLISTSVGNWEVGTVVNCAGLHSDRVHRVMGLQSEYRVIPFRGQYFELIRAVAERCKSLVYPVPDPRFPFLGVHLTPTIDGRLLVGPNAVLSLAREGYEGFHGELRDLVATLGFPGFWRLARKHWREGAGQFLQRWSRKRFLHEAQRLAPSIQAAQLKEGPCGIRAQVVARDGSLVHDFILEQRPGLLSVLNAPSPAATSALAIGEELASKI